jgi:phospholipid/cholesterol/gamma-HCH transport system substrate-binding protein
MMKLRAITASAAGVALLASGYGLDASDLARANNNRGDGYIVKVRVSDALNLPDGSPVRIGGVSIGRVKDVEAKDYRAIVSLRINNETTLREGTTVRLRYTTALGEMYVQVYPSATGEKLTDGAELPDSDAETAPSVEDALASASLLINGGGLGQIETIIEEINTALEGRVGTTHSLLRKTNIFLSTALASTREIDRILNALAASSTTLNGREATINAALKEIRPAAKTLTDNTNELVTLLQRSGKLGRTAKRIVGATRADLTGVVRELGPVLDEVLQNKDAILGALDRLTVASDTLDRVLPNTYLMFYLKIKAIPGQVQILGGPTIPLPAGDGPGGGGLPIPDLPLPQIPGLPLLPLGGFLPTQTGAP